VPPLIVFSHLRWDFVYQRPQQLLSRLAQQFPVVFVEEPMPGAAQMMLEVMHPCTGVEVLRPHLTGTAPGFHDDHIPQLRELLATYLLDRSIDAYWLWFYTPMALPLAAELAPIGIVYDCMDELAAFRNAPRQLIQRENALLKLADLVFTGGPSLHASKRDRHANAHCFPSSVDAAHYARPARAMDDRTLDHPAQRDIAHPRLGYFGVIDERIDLDLIASLADAHADWQIVLVGPLAKIDPASTPRRANIHWLGQRAYEDLPDLVAGWDVCLLPFALNDATRFISPTKTLEYLAADRPAVSTPIADVVGPYSDVVAIAATHADFVAACETALARTASDREADSRVRAEVVRSSSWDRTVDAMATLMQAVTATRDECGGPARTHDALAVGVGHANHGDVVQAKTLILGGGPTGLAAALRAGVDSVLLEKNPTVGGWCRSIEDDGFTFDHAGHIMFSTDPYVLDLYERLLGDNLHWQNREAWVYSQGVHTRYPFQAALYGLPAPVLQECLVGAIEARFGPIGKPTSKLSPTGPSRAATTTPEVADDAGKNVAALTPIVPRNFEEFIHTVWGAGVAKHFALPYNRKLWGLPLTEMETSWLGGRVPLPDLGEMIAGALAPIAKPLGPNARFGYPLRGGFQALMDGFLPLLEGTLETDATIVALSPATRTVTLEDGRAYRYESLISTLPLPRLVEMIGAEAPPAVREAVAGLRHVSVRCVNLGIGREDLTDKHWIYYPEDTVFHRVFVQGNTSPHCNAVGGFGLTCEITYSSEKPLVDDGEALTQRCIDDCIRVGLFKKEDAVWVANQVDMPYAYVVYDHTRAARVATIRDWLLARDIVLAGRYSEWEYYNSDHAFVAGRNAAETAIGLHAPATTDEELAVSA
jgi:UDP-galactopyranose mutase